ncbi:MAG: hypothetical protein H7Y32_04765, partial [Chloroflexales bacterium]|nr:hypothetical protein [Chloroflexales bacterium]
MRLGNTGFFGDEYNSLREFAASGLQPHSPVFFALMRAWGAVGGRDIVWLRLLTALLAALVVPTLYVLGRELGGGRAAGLGA